ncbi:MAG TPA: EAL domain-containing protein [Acidiphilium sp.]|uniref:putative bifunctional diguanylate cyclase/phosphodiesterase n=1 Tax=unclassified Acidiphilium TaxID=2617493 RepID=UPI000BDD8908|nr:MULTISPECIES: EAL domain-containing protein [unclassified Acidiphilium]OYV57333.1 MAG: GGDEF-domain containing protein [Acidiphilium sp. 20-67-58]HQT60483.1 EAL domain-containing protein [Acidiphilium sp.]HQU10453.1 EAL domain-containing protein [Acidiphilium sp.]
MSDLSRPSPGGPAALRGVIRALLGADAVPRHLAESVAIEGFELRARLTRVASLVGMGIAIVLAVDFRATLHRPAVAASLAVLLLACLVLFGVAAAWPALRRRRSDLLLIRIAFNGVTAVLGTAWAVYLNLLIRAVPPDSQGLLIGVFIGLLSSVISAGPLATRLAFWLPLTAGAFAALRVSASLWQPAIVITLALYSAFVLFTMVVLNRRMVEHGVSTFELRRINETIQMLLRDFEDNASDWLWETDARLNLVHPSPRLAEAARRDATAIGGNLFTFLASLGATDASAADTDAADGNANSDPYAELRRQIGLRRPFRDLLVPVGPADDRRWWSLTGKPTLDHHGLFAGYRGVGSDVTVAHSSRQRIDFLARHDPLTELLNRAAFGVLADQALATAGAAMLYLDLDQFKAVNDSYGHALGDSLLRAVAGRLRGAIRDTDIAARLGGDEFAVLLPGGSRLDATSMADRIIERLSPPYGLDGMTVEIGVSIGIALAPEDADTSDALLRNADLALYRAKQRGRGAWQLFDQAMDRQVQTQRGLRRDIRRALNDRELFLEYQPIVDLRSRRLRAVEALVRWRHPQRGVIGPEDFIAIAERGGLIGAVTRHVLAEAAAFALRLPPEISISINLSALHLREALQFDQISAVIAASGLDPRRIEFEVTETALLSTDDRTIDNLRRLRALGCSIAIDDFGTGFAALSTLRTFPFDRLKIDRSFIRELDRPGNAAQIVRAIIEFSRTLGLRVTVEGVETEAHAAALLAYPDIDAQGYLFSRPLSGDRLLVLAASGVLAGTGAAFG